MDQGWEILLQADYPAGARPVAVAHHPVLPLVALAYDDSLIEVWNVEKKVVIAALGADHWTTAVPDKKGVNIHSLTFYDSYTVHHKLLSTRANEGGSDAEKQSAEDKPEGRWLVVTTDSVVSFFDYLSQAVRHVSLAALDGKAALTVDFFPRSSVIAFACADGQVRLWDCARWARTLTLTSTSSKPIVAIFARLGANEITGEVVAAGDDGKALVFWKCPLVPNSEQKPIPSYDQKKGPDGAITSLAYDAFTDHLVASSEKSTVVWGLTEHKEVLRTKNPLKHAITSVHHFPPYSLLACVKDSSKVYILDEQFTASTNAEPFLDLDLLPAFKKELKPRKVVGLAVHSWGTHLLCLARPGFFVLAPPRPNPATGVTVVPPRPSAAGYIYYLREGEAIFTRDFNNSKVAKAHILSKKGAVRLQASPSYRHLTVTYDDTSFQVLDTTSWQCVHEGKAKSLAWRSPADQQQDVLAVLESIPVTPVVNEKEKKKKKDALSPRQFSMAVKFLVVDSGRVADTGADIDTDVEGEVLESLQSGPVIGLKYQPIPPPVRGDSKPSPPLLRFLVRGSQKIGRDGPYRPSTLAIPSADFGVWDEESKLCAIALPSSIRVFSLSSIEDNGMTEVVRAEHRMVSAVWANSCLFFATDRQIRCLMMGAHPLGTIVLASLSQGENDWQLEAASHGDSRRPIALRPPPPLSILAFLPQGELGVLTITGDVVKVAVNHALLKFYLLVTLPSVDEAVIWADKTDAACHEQMARLLALLGHEPHALRLRGVSPWNKLAICERHSLYAEGVALATSLASELQLVDNNNDNADEQAGQSATTKAVDNNTNDADDDAVEAQFGGVGGGDDGNESGATKGQTEKAKLVHYCLAFGHGAAKSTDWKCAIEAFRLAARLDPSAYRHLAATTLLAATKGAAIDPQQAALPALHAALSASDSLRHQANWAAMLVPLARGAGKGEAARPVPLLPPPSLLTGDVPLFRFTSPHHH